LLLETLHPHIDKDIFTRISSGDEQAFRFVFDQYKTRVYYFILRLVRSEEVAEELTQDVFMRLWISRATLTEVDNPNSYLFVAARNRSLDHLRRRKNERVMIQSMERRMGDGAINNTEEEVLYNETNRMLQEAVRLLPEQQRAVYRLSRLEGLSREEIAERLNISPNTVKNHLSSAIKTVKTYLEEHKAMIILFILYGIY
jgi:RNA polymerase sigma-70 factor (ECF subfamily)